MSDKEIAERSRKIRELFTERELRVLRVITAAHEDDLLDDLAMIDEGHPPVFFDSLYDGDQEFTKDATTLRAIFADD